MTPVYLAGRGLVCALGSDIPQSLVTLARGDQTASLRDLPGPQKLSFPYHRITGGQGDWDERARALVQKVAAEAGQREACQGVLFIASSSFDLGAIEQKALGIDPGKFGGFSEKIADWLNWQGPVYMINTACTSSLNAVIAAQALLSAGDFEEALILGVEFDNQLTFGGFASLQLLSTSCSKPFSVLRDGLVLGEAVSALRLSTSEPSRWKISGGANVVDGKQPTGASASAIVEMYQKALINSGVVPEAVDLIKVQAAGSPGNDAVEAQGLREAFQRVPPLASLKAALGHTMGASGAAEVALLTACLDQAAWPHYEGGVDETLGVELAQQAPTLVHHVLATILGFGGSHATVVLSCAS
jgi:3-oxoacyl-[acyl-carrier-protein] synthase I